MSKRRTFTKEKKLEILRYAEEYGMVATCREYELSQSLFYRWKHAFESKGVDGLEPAYYKVDPQVRDLEKENERLRKIIAKQALELEVKSELIKKRPDTKAQKAVILMYRDVVPVRWLCYRTGTPHSTFYYRSTEGKRGAKPSTHTLRTDSSRVSNALVVEEIKKILSQEFICYGYEKTTWELHDRGYIINKKKVYRLMKEEHLLLRHDRIATTGRRQFVRTRRIEADYPLQYLFMDIKYVWIQGERRNAYLLTVLDVFSRKVPAHSCKFSIKQTDVVLLLDGIVQN